ncbi:Alpha/Beta hydrolase protein [Bisporella sp. PMI_857]|nr:Alpha/Beta hydrolase protein [Bisporella sp. PMI_857]
MAWWSSILAKVYRSLALVVLVYITALIALTQSAWLQRHALYTHAIQVPTWWADTNNPEQFGFAKNQITPFRFTTPDHEDIYAWHVLPLAVYVKHESGLLQEPSGFVKDITERKAFKILRDDPSSHLIIKFHGTAGSVAQGWRTDAYRALSGLSNNHVLAIDYRGYGRSTGNPSEDGVIIDGIAAVDWAIKIAKVPPNRIVILGHSLGTAVAAAVAERFAMQGVEFAGIVLVSGFTDVTKLLTTYSIGGIVPVLSPLRVYPALQKQLSTHLIDKWPSAERIANLVRISKRVRLFFIHAKDDFEIPFSHSQSLFITAANATTERGMASDLLTKMKARSTIDLGNGATISTWKGGDNKVIREEILAYGHHSRLLTYAPTVLAVNKAFEPDEGMMLPP